MASYHPHCNCQAEVCNKTIAQYLATFVNESTMGWELYVPTLAFAYNTSFHHSIKAAPFSLTFGLEAHLHMFFAPISSSYMTLPVLAAPSWTNFVRHVPLLSKTIYEQTNKRNILTSPQHTMPSIKANLFCWKISTF
jgi:hypothetical protein